MRRDIWLHRFFVLSKAITLSIASYLHYSFFFVVSLSIIRFINEIVARLVNGIYMADGQMPRNELL